MAALALRGLVLTGPLQLDEFRHLAAVVEQKGRLGLAWVELSTGRFSLCEVQRRELLDEVARLDPAELLVSETAIDAPWVRLVRQQAPALPITLSV